MIVIILSDYFFPKICVISSISSFVNPVTADGRLAPGNDVYLIDDRSSEQTLTD